MNKIIVGIIALIIAIPLTAFTMQSRAPKIEQKEIIIFSQPCYFCEKLKAYLATGVLEKKYPNLGVKILDISNPENLKELEKYAKIHNLSGDIGLPIIFIGKEHIMGWSDEWADRLDMYIEKYLGQNYTAIDID